MQLGKSTDITNIEVSLQSYPNQSLQKLFDKPAQSTENKKDVSNDSVATDISSTTETKDPIVNRVVQKKAPVLKQYLLENREFKLEGEILEFIQSCEDYTHPLYKDCMYALSFPTYSTLACIDKNIMLTLNNGRLESKVFNPHTTYNPNGREHDNKALLVLPVAKQRFVTIHSYGDAVLWDGSNIDDGIKKEAHGFLTFAKDIRKWGIDNFRMHPNKGPFEHHGTFIAKVFPDQRHIGLLTRFINDIHTDTPNHCCIIDTQTFKMDNIAIVRGAIDFVITRDRILALLHDGNITVIDLMSKTVVKKATLNAWSVKKAEGYAGARPERISTHLWKAGQDRLLLQGEIKNGQSEVRIYQIPTDIQEPLKQIGKIPGKTVLTQLHSGELVFWNMQSKTLELFNAISMESSYTKQFSPNARVKLFQDVGALFVIDNDQLYYFSDTRVFTKQLLLDANYPRVLSDLIMSYIPGLEEEGSCSAADNKIAALEDGEVLVGSPLRPGM